MTAASTGPADAADPMERVTTGGPSPGERILYAFVRAVLVGFGRTWFRVSLRGRDHVPARGSFILAPVHRSNLDFLIVLVCARRRMRYLAKDSLWRPGWGRLFSALGGIPVSRGSADRDALRISQAVIESGEPLVVFPEGARQTGSEVLELYDGAAFLQARTGVPIVPVGIGGSEAAMPKGSKMVWPRRVTVEVGEAMPAPDVEGAKARRTAIRARTGELRGELQVLFDRAQRRVRS